jgi:hypothetical protein
MLQDGVQLSSGSTIAGLVAESGVSFPTSPQNGQQFNLTETVGQNVPGSYEYESASSTWFLLGDITNVVAGTGLYC